MGLGDIAVIGGSSGNSYKGLYVIPEESTKKFYPLSCGVCENYAKKYLSCLLRKENQSEEELLERCLPTAQDVSLFFLCGFFAAGSLTDDYAVVTPFIFAGTSALVVCNSIDATKKNNGNWIVKARKDSILPFDGSR